MIQQQTFNQLQPTMDTVIAVGHYGGFVKIESRSGPVTIAGSPDQLATIRRLIDGGQLVPPPTDDQIPENSGEVDSGGIQDTE